LEASMVARGNGQTVYVLGPEVSTFVLDETMLGRDRGQQHTRSRGLEGYFA
jgi:hypothetical protein